MVILSEHKKKEIMQERVDKLILMIVVLCVFALLYFSLQFSDLRESADNAKAEYQYAMYERGK